METRITAFTAVPGAGPDDSPIVYAYGSDDRIYWCYGDRTDPRWTILPPLPDNDGDA